MLEVEDSTKQTSVLPKVNYRFNTIPIQRQNTFLIDIDNLMLILI